LGITRQLSKLEYHLVDVTPSPVFPWLEGTDNRVLRRVKVFGGMLILGIIAAANMPAFETEAQVYPRIPDFQTILAAIRAWCNMSYLVQVSTLYSQDRFLSNYTRYPKEDLLSFISNG